MGYFDSLLSKEGENISHYVHSWETSRNSTTNLKESKWAAAVTVNVVVRSQPSITEQKEEGLVQPEIILVLTTTEVIKLDVILWKEKYFDVTMVEEVYWKGTRQYYRARCIERLEFLGN